MAAGDEITLNDLYEAILGPFLFLHLVLFCVPGFFICYAENAARLFCFGVFVKINITELFLHKGISLMYLKNKGWSNAG